MEAEEPLYPSPTDVVAMETPRAPDPPQNGPLSFSGISILDRLIKTCPVWLQLCMGAPQVEEILCREAAGVFLVTRDVEVKCMVLWVRSPESPAAAAVLRYNIREEKTMMYLEGSMLVFKDIFKLVAFYCISRDILPSVLKLPPAISGAQSLQDLEEISNLGAGFWDKPNTFSGSSQSGKSPAPEIIGSDHVRRCSGELGDCACEIEICAGVERLWFVTPIFIEDCSNADSSPKLPLTNYKAELPKMMHRRPPPPPPTLHKPPLPSVPPSAPPPNYKRPQSESSPLKSPAPPRPAASKRGVPAEPPPSTSKRGVPAEPPPSETLTGPPPSETLTEPPPSETLTEPPPSRPSTSKRGVPAEPPPPRPATSKRGVPAEPPPSTSKREVSAEPSPSETLTGPPPSRPSTSKRGVPAEPPPSKTFTGPPPSETLIEPPPSETLIEPPPSETLIEPPPSETLTDLPPSETLIEPPPSETLTDLPPSKTLIDPPPSETLTKPSASRPSTCKREVSAELSPSETLTGPPPSKSKRGVPAEPPSSKTLTEPPPSKTLIDPPPSGTLIEPPPSKTTTCPPFSSPQSSGTPTEPQLSETPSKPPPFEPPQSLDLSSSPKTSSHNLVDLLDHPIGSPLEPSPDPYSLTSSGLQSSQSTSPPSDCSPILTSHHKDDEDPQPEACLLPSLDVDLLKEPLKNMKINALCNDSPQQGPQTPSPVRAPPAVPRRRPSGKVPESKVSIVTMKDEAAPRSPVPKSKMPTSDKTGTLPKQHGAMEETGKKTPPVPPPRTKKLSGRSSSVSPVKVGPEKLTKTSESQSNSSGGKAADRRVSRQKRVSAPALKSSDLSLSSHGSDPTMATADADSYSTSSADDESEPPSKASIKKSHSFMLERAKNRLSMVAITNVFSAFMSADRKLQKKIAELAHDKDSYFGNLVQDYKTYSLEMMAKQSSSTEMLQEIRLMMTQLKSYLVQSAELKSMVDYSLYTDDKIDAIVESALCKCVLKPLKSPIECYLREIHNKDGALRLLTENQQVIQETTTTDLGVTTSVPDSGVMEKILHKFSTMNKTYSPEKKVTYLLKACKLIYDSMAAGNPGKPHGADDFLPVLMYVLAQCDLVALLLDVEYMMELMDPALQLGEGSYYLTTTYGALEHIKNYDKITVTRQLSVEVQDSIHRWERRRTLNKAKVSRSSIQDFITISFEELDSNTRTLATKADMNVAEVARQCAEKFQVSEAADYGLFVTVNERCVRLTEDAFPQQVKTRLLKDEHKLDFHFIYKRSGAQDIVMSELHFL